MAAPMWRAVLARHATPRPPVHRATAAAPLSSSPASAKDKDMDKDKDKEAALGPRSRLQYPFFLDLQTRWSDNDQYGHVNNAIYYHYFDTVVNWWLIHRCGLRPAGGDVIGLVAETRCSYHASVGYPDVVELGLAVKHIGRSSVQYQIGVFKKGAPAADASAAADLAAAVGHFVHVYVDAATRKPLALPAALRTGLQPLLLLPGPAALSRL